MMSNCTAMGIKYENEALKILDQRQLPHKEDWVVCESPTHMIELIQVLAVRGAPLIGVAAVLSLADYALKGATIDEIKKAASLLRNARPTAVNLAAAIKRVLYALNANPKADTIVHIAEQVFNEDKALCDKIADHGVSLINDGDNIVTICNTGGLATAGIGTALGVITKAYEEKKSIHVYPLETRPLLQGGRLTAWELAQHKIPYQLITDNMIAALMTEKKIDKIFVGADRVAANGDTANKIGTHQLAIIAKHFKVPLYVVAPYTTLDSQTGTGSSIPIEQRDAKEVLGVNFAWGGCQWAPDHSEVFNPAFDVTPFELITGYVTDKGVFEDAKSLFSA